MFLERDVETDLRAAAQNFEADFFSGTARKRMKCNVWQAIRVSSVDGQKDISDAYTRGFRGTAGKHIGNDDAVISRQFQALRHLRRNGLKLHADFRPVQMPVLAQLF